MEIEIDKTTSQNKFSFPIKLKYVPFMQGSSTE